MASAARNEARWRRQRKVHTKWNRGMEASKASHTPGKQKTEWCQADKTKRFMAGRSRAYKHSQYAAWCAKMDSINRRGA